MTLHRLARRVLLAGLPAAALVAPGRAGAAPLSPRALYDEDGRIGGAARAAAGSRVTLRGFLSPTPAPEPGWVALSEMPVAPCSLCGVAHDWPLGVVAVEAPELPHVASGFQAVLIEGRLDLSPDGAAAAGLPGRASLRDATLALG